MEVDKAQGEISLENNPSNTLSKRINGCRRKSLTVINRAEARMETTQDNPTLQVTVSVADERLAANIRNSLKVLPGEQEIIVTNSLSLKAKRRLY